MKDPVKNTKNSKNGISELRVERHGVDTMTVPTGSSGSFSPAWRKNLGPRKRKPLSSQPTSVQWAKIFVLLFNFKTCISMCGVW